MNDIPMFPEFKPISLDDKAWFEQFTARFEPYADFGFHNMIIWMNLKNDLEISLLNSNLVYRFTNCFEITRKGDKTTYSLAGKNDIADSINQVFGYQKSIGVNPSLQMIPAFAVEAIDSTNRDFNLQEERDNWEYVLDARLLATLEGKTMRDMRVDCNSFQNKHSGSIDIKQLDLSQPEYARFLRKSLHQWWRRDYVHRNDIDLTESEVIDHLLQNAQVLDYKNISLFINGQLEGFVLYHYLQSHKEWVMPSTIKISYAYNDLSDFLVHSFAKEVYEHGVKYINFEQDLGMPGLRYYKTSLKPIYFLKKFTITPV